MSWGQSQVSFDTLPPLASVMGMLAFDTFLYWLLGWYLSYVIPGDYGVTLPFYFPFLPSFWGCHSPPSGNHFNEEDPIIDQTLREQEDPHGHVGVKILGLSKEFSTRQGKFQAVDNVRLNLFEGEVLSLLGHNGAGKTTTLGMLCGMIPPSRGDALIFGRSIKGEMN